MFHVKHSVDITGFQLKLAAIAAMTCNHVANVFGEYLSDALDLSLYAVGGMTFPIMAFLLVEGFDHTSNLRRYALRLLVFALIAQVPYSLLFGAPANVLFTLLIGLGILWLSHRFSTGAGLLAAVACTLLLQAFVDWGTTGFIVIYLFGTLRESRAESTAHDLPPAPAQHGEDEEAFLETENPAKESPEGAHPETDNPRTESSVPRPATAPARQSAKVEVPCEIDGPSRHRAKRSASQHRADIACIVGTMVLLGCITCLGGFLAGDMSAIGYALVGYTIAAVLLCLYRGRRGHSMKWFFYAYYPLHLLAIWLITVIMQ